MSKHAGHDRHIRGRMADIRLRLDLPVQENHIGETATGEVRLSSRVFVHLDDLERLAQRVDELADRCVRAEEAQRVLAELEDGWPSAVYAARMRLGAGA